MHVMYTLYITVYVCVNVCMYVYAYVAMCMYRRSGTCICRQFKVGNLTRQIEKENQRIARDISTVPSLK